MRIPLHEDSSRNGENNIQTHQMQTEVDFCSICLILFHDIDSLKKIQRDIMKRLNSEISFSNFVTSHSNLLNVRDNDTSLRSNLIC